MTTATIDRHPMPAIVTDLASLDALPAELRALPQWIVWRHDLDKNGKPVKTPYSPLTGRRAKSNDPTTWTTFDIACDFFEVGESWAGIGFMFTLNDPFCGVDLDDCIDADGAIVPEAQAIIDRCNGYAELSPSGRGVKIWIRGRKPEQAGCKRDPRTFKRIEIYDTDRFFAVTGATLGGQP